MPIILIPTLTKRPADATPEKLLRLREAGASVAELIKICNVNRSRVYALLAKARKARKAAA